MRQSTLHVGVIMDGNGRWATARGRPREWGHRQGAKAVRRLVEVAPDRGIGALTLYAFSSDNWSRPPGEVRFLMRLFRRYLRSEVEELAENGVRLQVIGRRDRLEPTLVRAIEEAEARAAGGERLLLRLAVDYSGRDALVEAARLLRGNEAPDREAFRHAMGRALHTGEPALDVDLLIRTGGEKRLSDFLLWESAYAELVFTPRMWPDFQPADLDAALREYARRERRFGGLSAVG